jgi:hypothetical protein
MARLPRFSLILFLLYYGNLLNESKVERGTLGFIAENELGSANFKPVKRFAG